MSLKEYSTEDLRKELTRREEESSAAAPLEKIDWQPVIDLVIDGVDTMRNECYEPKDFEHYVYEAVMEAVYGKDVWKWYNDLL